MSIVTTAIVHGIGGCDSIEGHDCSVVDALNSYLRSVDVKPMRRIDHHTGGNSAAIDNIWMVSVNGLDVSAFVRVYQDALKNKKYAIIPRMMLKRDDDYVFYTVPLSDDGRTWHYRDATLDENVPEHLQ